MQQRTGVLSSQHIQEMMRIGAVVNGRADCINPASLDVTLSRTVYRLANVFLPLSRESMDDSLASAGATKHSLSDPLEHNVPYLIQLRESIDLSRVPNVYGFCNPKSTTGRVDMHVRIITEGNSRYDTAPEGYKGSMWLLAIPRSFPISVSPGERLAQIRFFDDDTRLTETELALAINSTDGLLYDRFGKKFSFKHLYISDNDGGLILTFDKESTQGYLNAAGESAFFHLAMWVGTISTIFLKSFLVVRMEALLCIRALSTSLRPRNLSAFRLCLPVKWCLWKKKAGNFGPITRGLSILVWAMAKMVSEKAVR